MPKASAKPRLPVAVNLGKASERCEVGARSVVFRVPEAGEGNSDLNGDGDKSDHVAHVYDAKTGVTTSLGLACDFPEATGDLSVFSVPESAQASVDRNGDGDALDHVLQVYDARSDSSINLGMAVPAFLSFHAEGHLVAFLVREAEHGALDLNGDGDALDNVLHLYDHRQGTITNLGIGCDSNVFLKVAGETVAFLADEGMQGADLNGDSDAFDDVMHVYDHSAGTTSNLALAVHSGIPEFDTGGALVGFEVREGAQGQTDLNGDGDWFDDVMFVHDVGTATTKNVAIAGAEPEVDGRAMSFRAVESSEGADLNGDGDANDAVFHVYDDATGTLTNLGLAGVQYATELDDGLLAFLVIESWQGNTDFNADGDTSDWVLHTYDLATATSTNIGLACSQGLQVEGGRVFAQVSESKQGMTDLNGDGDTDDGVLHVYLAGPGVVRNLRRASSGSSFIVAADGGRAVFRVRESDQADHDLNGDGDSQDYVLHVYDLSADRVFNMKLASGTPLVEDGLAGFLVNEAQQGGADLNGDGDTLDLVQHVVL